MLVIPAIVAVLVLWFFFSKKNAPDKSPVSPDATSPTEVTVKTAKDLQVDSSEERVPGIIAPEQETVIVASISGTIASAPFEVGDTVSVGSTVFRIDTPFTSAISKDGIPSDSVRQAEISVSLANKAYKDAKRLAEKESTKSTSNTLAENLAALKLESAKIALENARNGALVRSTIAGSISEKNVGIGSSVSPGTTLATIASGTAPKVRFHVSANTRQSLKVGDMVTVVADTASSEARISSIGAIADSGTGKFPVEARFSDNRLRAGAIATIIIKTENALAGTSNFSLPLSAITTGQDGSFFFVENGGKAKKVNADSVVVSGERGIVSADIPSDARIIIESGKAIDDGSDITVKE